MPHSASPTIPGHPSDHPERSETGARRQKVNLMTTQSSRSEIDTETVDELEFVFYEKEASDAVANNPVRAAKKGELEENECFTWGVLDFDDKTSMVYLSTPSSVLVSDEDECEVVDPEMLLSAETLEIRQSEHPGDRTVCWVDGFGVERPIEFFLRYRHEHSEYVEQALRALANEVAARRGRQLPALD